MRQLKVSLSDRDFDLLEAEADLTGRSMSELVRTRFLKGSEGPPPETHELLTAITRLMTLIEEQTKRTWHSHPAAIRVLQDAIVARLERLRGGAKEAEFTFDELPSEERLVAPVGAADQRVWGAALEALEFRTYHTVREILPPHVSKPGHPDGDDMETSF